MDNVPSTMGEVLIWVLATQAILYGIGKGLGKIMDRTKTTADNKAFKVVQFLLTVLDMLTGNREHKDDPRPAFEALNKLKEGESYAKAIRFDNGDGPTNPDSSGHST